MDNRYYLAVDIGASSGRHILSHMENGKIILEEVYRFHNGMTEKDGHKIWDVDRLFEEILTGMKKCSEIGKMPYSIGIHGLSILCYWTMMTERLWMRLLTEMTGQQGLIKRCMK